MIKDTRVPYEGFEFGDEDIDCIYCDHPMEFVRKYKVFPTELGAFDRDDNEKAEEDLFYCSNNECDYFVENACAHTYTISEFGQDQDFIAEEGF